MTKIKYIYFILIGALLFGACVKEDFPKGIEPGIDEIAISYAQQKYVAITSSETRNINADLNDEEQIDNIYILLFGNDLRRYYTSTANFAQGVWDASAERVTIKLTQSQAAQRDVYVIANVSSSLKTTLDGVSNLAQLQQALESNDEPWSPNLSNATKSILMSGMESHDFEADRLLSSVELIRAIAKVELNVKLPEKHQSANGADYKYNFVDFDKNTYVLENLAKIADVVSTGSSTDTPATWVGFSADGSDQVSSYKIENGKITELKIVTYINETTDAESYIELLLPYEDGGFLPPPEFGPEKFILPRQGEIKRNHWYKYDVEL